MLSHVLLHSNGALSALADSGIWVRRSLRHHSCVICASDSIMLADHALDCRYYQHVSTPQSQAKLCYHCCCCSVPLKKRGLLRAACYSLYLIIVMSLWIQAFSTGPTGWQAAAQTGCSNTRQVVCTMSRADIRLATWTCLFVRFRAVEYD